VRILNIGKKFGCCLTRFPFDGSGYADITIPTLSSGAVLCDGLKLYDEPIWRISPD